MGISILKVVEPPEKFLRVWAGSGGRAGGHGQPAVGDLRRPGLADSIQRDYRVIVSGPTTFAAVLNSLQMGFRTLAIEQRSSEIWILLGAVKTEFGKFGDVIDATQKKLEDASKHFEKVGKRTRAINRKLKDVEALPVAEEVALGLLEADDES